MKKRIRTGCVVLVLLAAATAANASDAARSVVVNRVLLPAETLSALEQHYGVRIADGRYWYDPVSGLWGPEGGPSQGQILPGLPLGGPLRADASGGLTAVVINGRVVHPIELAVLQQTFGVVMPGRYWLNAQGIGGFEGGPPQFSLGTGGGGRGRRSVLGHSDTGSVIGGDGIVGYVGGDVGITCGPDGGCF